MNPLLKGFGSVLTTAAVAAGAADYAPNSVSAADPVKPAVIKVDKGDEFGDNSVANRLAKEVREETSATEEMVTKKDGTKVPRSEYINLVITNAQKDGIIKTAENFKTRDLAGKEILDGSAYEAYIASIKDRAAQFKDAKDFSKFINAIRILRDVPGSDKAVLTPMQSSFLVEYVDPIKADEVAGRLHGGLATGWNVRDLRSKADEYIRKLETTLLSSNR